MLRFAWTSPALLAALVLAVGTGSATAGVWDFWKFPAKKASAKAAKQIEVVEEEEEIEVVRAQEPSAAPPATLDVQPDPAYTPPTDPLPTQPSAPAPMPGWTPPAGAYDCAPQYSGFSGGYGSGPCTSGYVCNGCREPNGLCQRMGFGLAKSSARMHGDSYYCDCYPLFGPRYGYFDTCWRRLPEDCRCPILVPPRKSPTTPDPIPTDGGEITPPPPQAFQFR